MINIATDPIKKAAEERNIVSKISDIISSIGFISEKDRNYTLSDHIAYLLKASESSEPKTKNKIENHLVKLGKKAVPCLVKALYSTTGPTRGLAAMALIRIGSPSISHLKQSAVDYPEAGWISDYIIREIESTQAKIFEFIDNQNLETALVS